MMTLKNSTPTPFKEVADIETGEITEAITIEDLKNYTLIHKDQQAKKDTYTQEKPFKTKFNTLSGGFTFTMINTLKELIADTTFTQAEKTRIMFLGTYASYDTDFRYLTHGNGQPVLKNKLMDLLDMTNRKEFYAFYNKLVTAGIMTEEVLHRSCVKLLWSEKYHFKGKTSTGSHASENMLKTYDKQIREMYKARDENGKAQHTPHSLFTIFTLMPYIHPESNALCKYPEKPYHASEPFTLHELADLYGYERSNDLKRILFKIRLHNMPAVAITQTSEGTRLFINPFIVNRTGKTPNATLFTLFDLSFNTLANKQSWNEKDKQSFLNHK